MSGSSSSSLLSISALLNSIRMTSLSVLRGSAGFFSGTGGGASTGFFCGGAFVLAIRPLPKNILYISSPLVRTIWFPKTWLREKPWIFSPTLNIWICPVCSFFKMATDADTSFDTITPTRDKGGRRPPCSWAVTALWRLKMVEKKKNPDNRKRIHLILIFLQRFLFILSGFQNKNSSNHQSVCWSHAPFLLKSIAQE